MQLVNLTHGFLVMDMSVMISLVLKAHAPSTDAVGFFFFSSTAFQLPQGVFNTILIISILFTLSFIYNKSNNSKIFVEHFVHGKDFCYMYCLH